MATSIDLAVDTSALTAILLGEPDAPALLGALKAAPRIGLCASNRTELLVVLQTRPGDAGVERAKQFLASADLLAAAGVEHLVAATRIQHLSPCSGVAPLVPRAGVELLMPASRVEHLLAWARVEDLVAAFAVAGAYGAAEQHADGGKHGDGEPRSRCSRIERE
jgi:hypothetical protein